MKKQEKILCAAMHIDDGVSCRPKPAINLKTGVVVCGYRHDACFFVADAIYPSGWENIHTITHGFLTSKNRFVDRKEAAIIAYEAKQINEPANVLTSEDLY